MSMYPDEKEIEVSGTVIKFPGLDENKKFSNGDFNNPEIPASFIPAETVNLIVDNLSELVEAGKKEDEEIDTPNNKDTDQVLNAVAELIRRPIDALTEFVINIRDNLLEAIKNINDNLVKNIRNVIFPVGSYYVQYAGVGNTFQANESPAAMFGGSWSILWNGESNFFRTEGWLANEGRSNGVQQDASQLFAGEFGDFRFNDSYGRVTTGILRYARTQHVAGSPGNGYGNINTIIYRVSNDYQVRTSMETRSVNRLIRVYRRTGLSS